MTEVESQFSVLRRTADPAVVAAIETVVASGADRDLARINPLAFANKRGLDTERTIAAFLHASRLGLFEMQWNVLCPGCGGVLGANASLKTVHQDIYNCQLCSAGYEPSLDEMVDVTFTVGQRVRRIGAHDPDTLPRFEYARQVFFGSGSDLPDDLEQALDEVTIEFLELPAGEKAVVSVQLPPGNIVVFDPVTHSAHFLTVKGEPTRERQNLSIVYNKLTAATGAVELRPGPMRIAFENQTDRRTLPSIWLYGEQFAAILGRRRPFLTAKRLLSNQTFRDLYRTDALEIDQRLKILSLTFLFTDLKGSTELYERVGDLAAYDLVRSHFHVLHEIVAEETGAVVKTIGDAVMATFVTPDRAIAAALRMRDGMEHLNQQRGHEDLLLKIGIHEGPCLAVNLNDRQDYFGQTVNIASRVQNLAVDRSIYATEPVVENAASTALLAKHGLRPSYQQQALKGVTERVKIYEIP
jgi:class 3 adenylate cyclase